MGKSYNSLGSKPAYLLVQSLCVTPESPSLPWKPVATSLSTAQTQTCCKLLFPSITMSKQRKFGADVIPGLFANNALIQEHFLITSCL